MPELRERDIPSALLRELPRLKEKHPHVYAVKTAGGIFAVRPLVWNEFLLAQEKVQREVLPELFIVKSALLWPEEIPGDAPAGIISTLAASILDISGFQNPVALDAAMAMADYELATDPSYTMIMLICKAFPAYKPEDLFNMPFLDLVQRFKMAEKMLGLDQVEQQPVKRQRRVSAAPPIEDSEVAVFGPDEEFIPEVVSSPNTTRDPLRDPDLPPPDFEADNRFFRKHFRDLTRPPQLGEV